MDSDQFARLIYLGVWGSVLIGYVLIARQQNIGQTLRHAVLWGLLFVGVAAGYGLWQDITQNPRQPIITGDGGIVLQAGQDGHFQLTLQVNDQPVRFLVDTGASDLVLSRSDAARVGLNPDRLAYLGQARTANGIVGIARVNLDEVTLSHGDLEIRDHDVAAFVNEGQLEVSLLGMGYLRRYARIAIEGDRLILER